MQAAATESRDAGICGGPKKPITQKKPSLLSFFQHDNESLKHIYSLSVYNYNIGLHG